MSCVVYSGMWYVQCVRPEEKEKRQTESEIITASSASAIQAVLGYRLIILWGSPASQVEVGVRLLVSVVTAISTTCLHEKEKETHASM
jgi:hypothetical protein